MSEKFTASNGQTVAIVDGDLMVGNPPLALSPVGVEAMREFFLHERDQELGRWRDPVAADYYVVNTDEGQTVVVNERTSRWNPITRGLVENYPDMIPAHEVGARYFAAHPLPKPAWHDAQAGEVWLMQTEETEYVMVAYMPIRDVRFRVNDKAGTIFDPESPVFTAGRRIWPEAVES